MRGLAALGARLRSAAALGEPLLAAFDFDGVLAPIRRRPSQARMSARTRKLLVRAARSPGTTVLVVSGRPMSFLRRAVGSCGALLAAEHGLEVEGSGVRWRHPAFSELGRHARALARAARRRVRGLPGVQVELKNTAVSVHWRRSPAVRRDPDGLRRALEELLPPGWRVAPGLMVWELRPKLDWGKGHAVRRAAELSGSRVLFAGDDWTDEEGFVYLGRSAWTVRVGPGPTAARWRLPGIREVDALLAAIAESRQPGFAASARRTRARSSTKRAPQR